MVTGENYDDERIAACRSVLIEVLTILGKHREYLVVVGGWVPPLLFGPGDHIGSLDVDLAIDARRMPSYVYETIPNELRKHNYYTAESPNRLLRELDVDGRPFTVIVDLMTAPGSTPPQESHRLVHGMQTWCASGVEVALDHFVDREIDGKLPTGGINRVTVHVASAA
jgi:hypothetical protein